MFFMSTMKHCLYDTMFQLEMNICQQTAFLGIRYIKHSGFILADLFCGCLFCFSPVLTFFFLFNLTETYLKPIGSNSETIFILTIWNFVSTRYEKYPWSSPWASGQPFSVAFLNAVTFSSTLLNIRFHFMQQPKDRGGSWSNLHFR